MYKVNEAAGLPALQRVWQWLEESELDFSDRITMALRQQQALEDLAKKFRRKAALREGWLQDRWTVLSDMTFGETLLELEAAGHKEDSIATMLDAFAPRVNALSSIHGMLADKGYHGIEAVTDKMEAILSSWSGLQGMLETRRLALDHEYQVCLAILI